MERDELVRALRCQATVGAECIGDCPYFCREEIPEELREAFGGKTDLPSCDGDRCLLDAADLIEAQAREIETLRKQVPQWVSVAERVPENPGDYIVHIRCVETLTVLTYYGSRKNGEQLWCDEDGIYYNVTHWMPLPEAPKEDA